MHASFWLYLKWLFPTTWQLSRDHPALGLCVGSDWELDDQPLGCLVMDWCKTSPASRSSVESSAGQSAPPASCSILLSQAWFSDLMSLWCHFWRNLHGRCQSRWPCSIRLAAGCWLFYKSGFLRGQLRVHWKVYVAAIAAEYVLVTHLSLGRYSLISHFMYGARRLKHFHPTCVPSCDLSLKGDPFESLESALEEVLTLELVLLLAILFLKRIGDVQVWILILVWSRSWSRPRLCYLNKIVLTLHCSQVFCAAIFFSTILCVAGKCFLLGFFRSVWKIFGWASLQTFIRYYYVNVDLFPCS